MKSATGDVPMSAQQIAEAEAGIQKMVPSFNYSLVLSDIKDRSKMKDSFQAASVGYDKLQIFRIFKEIHGAPSQDQSSVFHKFVNESFHIENEYVMQLNPHKFDSIPEYITNECERVMLIN